MAKSPTFWSSVVGVAGIPTALTGLQILSEQGSNSPWGWLIVAVGSLCIMGGGLFVLLLNERPSGRARVTAKADGQSRVFASGGPMTIGTYNEAAPTPATRDLDEAQRVSQSLAELRRMTFQLGPNDRRYNLGEILLMAADRLTTPTSLITFQATIQNAIPQPDQPTDHKDVPPEILSQLSLHEVVDAQRIDPSPGAGSIRPTFHDLPYTAYQLTSLGKELVRLLRAEQLKAERTRQLAEFYNEGKRLLLFEPDSAWPRDAAELGGFLKGDLIAGDFKDWDHPCQQFIYDNYGLAESTLYGNAGFPMGDGTLFDVIRARLTSLEKLMRQLSATSSA